MKDFLNKLASDSPTPGGGSASAASGAIGAALLSKIFLILKKRILKDLEGRKESKISKSKYNSRNKGPLSREEVGRLLVKEFEKSADKTKKVMNKLILLIDEDANAYGNVLEKIRKLREVKRLEICESKAEIDISKAKEDLQDAYKYAAEVPFQIAKLCYKIFREHEGLSERIASPVKSDFQIAISLLRVGIEGAALNVNLNLNEIDDKNFVKEKRKELNKILKYRY